jgi:hypothetical protein
MYCSREGVFLQRPVPGDSGEYAPKGILPALDPVKLR